MITIDLSSSRVPVGGVLRGRIRAEPNQGEKARALVFEVGWRTEGRGSRDNAVVVTERREAASERPSWDEPFEVALPAHGPTSYDGKLIRILWEVRVSLDAPWAADESAVQPFTVTLAP